MLDGRCWFLFGLLCFLGFALLTFSHDRSPCVVEYLFMVIRMIAPGILATLLYYGRSPAHFHILKSGEANMNNNTLYRFAIHAAPNDKMQESNRGRMHRDHLSKG